MLDVAGCAVCASVAPSSWRIGVRSSPPLPRRTNPRPVCSCHPHHSAPMYSRRVVSRGGTRPLLGFLLVPCAPPLCLRALLSSMSEGHAGMKEAIEAAERAGGGGGAIANGHVRGRKSMTYDCHRCFCPVRWPYAPPPPCPFRAAHATQKITTRGRGHRDGRPYERHAQRHKRLPSFTPTAHKNPFLSLGRLRGGGGGWDPKICGPKNGQTRFPQRYTMVTLVSGGGVMGGRVPSLLLRCTAILILPQQQAQAVGRQQPAVGGQPLPSIFPRNPAHQRPPSSPAAGHLLRCIHAKMSSYDERGLGMW